MSSARAFRSIAVMAGGIALAWTAILSGAHASQAQSPAPLAPGDPSPAPTDTAAPSYAPADPVDCTDPNNVINCQTPPIDSPLVVGTAEPGSPFRD